jgi:hypothetical protein
MKNFFLIILTLFSISFWINVYADGEGTVTVIVTEKLPWADCDTEKTIPTTSGSDGKEMTVYECQVKKWTAWFFDALSFVIKYFTYIVGLLWVLFIVYNWILYSMWWIDDSSKADAKKRIIWTILGLVLLFLAWTILKLIAPWIYV